MDTFPDIKWFVDITIDDVPPVGGKHASLGEVVRELASQGVKVPNGVTIIAEAYRLFIREAGIDESIWATLADIATGSSRRIHGLQAHARRLRNGNGDRLITPCPLCI